jgi:hypothetical protein
MEPCDLLPRPLPRALGIPSHPFQITVSVNDFSRIITVERMAFILSKLAAIDRQQGIHLRFRTAIRLYFLSTPEVSATF